MKTKKEIANKMLSNKERKIGVSPLDGFNFRMRAANKNLKVIRRVKRATVRRLERDIAKDKGVKVSYSIK